ncbi:hypothetical protein LIZ85_21660, partial [[Eubacterium] rectale]|nr:hypothetical protein [Agathobacter rectalis]
SFAIVRGKTTLEKYSFCDLLINKRDLTSFAVRRTAPQDAFLANSKYILSFSFGLIESNR